MHLHTRLCALALALPAFCLPSASASSVSADGPLKLRSIHVADFESAFGIQRRAAEEFSSLDLQTQEQLIYGRPGGDGQLLLANMTLYAEDGLQIVLMERFEGLTESVDCKGDDGTMSLTFNSQAAFQYALQTWEFINESAEKKFLLIANHNGCGPDDERQPYLITNICEDVPTLTTFLTAQVAKWSEVAGTYDLDFGHALVPKKSSSHSRRGLFSGIDNIVHNVADDFKHFGDFNYDKSVTFPVAVGTPNQASSILDTSTVKINCVNCYVAGSFKLTGHISTKHFKPQDIILSASPVGVAAELELGTTITSSLTPDTLSYSKTLFTAPIPDAGISVPGIFQLGAIISYDVGVSASFSGSATVQYGLSASIPDTAQIVANLESPSSSTATGFDGGQVTPIFDVTALSAGVTLAAYSEPKLSFGIELTDIATFEVEFGIKLPEVSATLAGAYNAAGLCSPGSSKTGVNLSSSVGIEVDFEVDADLGPENKHNFTTKLFGISHDLGSKCFPVNIPGLGPAHSSVSVPASVTLPSATTMPTAVLTSVGTAAPILPTRPVYGTAVSGSVGTAVPFPTGGPANGTAPIARRRVRLA